MTEEDIELLLEVKGLLTGKLGGYDESMAPLLCNSADIDYGMIVILGADQFVRHHTYDHNDTQWQEWTNVFNKTRIQLRDDGFWVYLHQNYSQSTIDSIEAIVCKWAKEMYYNWTEAL